MMFFFEGGGKISEHRDQKLKYLSFLFRRKKAQNIQLEANKKCVDFLFHWKDIFNPPKRSDEAIFVHVCSGGLSQYLLEVRKRFLLLIHVCLFWIFLQFSWRVCSLPESETGHGIAQGLAQNWQPPPHLSTLCMA